VIPLRVAYLLQVKEGLGVGAGKLQSSSWKVGKQEQWIYLVLVVSSSFVSQEGTIHLGSMFSEMQILQAAVQTCFTLRICLMHIILLRLYYLMMLTKGRLGSFNTIIPSVYTTSQR
jgi:hypothetical protein